MFDSYDIQRIENAIWVLSEYQCALTECSLENAATSYDYDAQDIYHSIYNLMKMSDDIFNTNFLGEGQ